MAFSHAVLFVWEALLFWFFYMAELRQRSQLESHLL
jgi:hypothetical protein